MSLDQAINQVVAQMPTVVILLYIMSQQTKGHQASVDYYRAQVDRLTRFLENLTLKFVKPVTDEDAIPPQN